MNRESRPPMKVVSQVALKWTGYSTNMKIADRTLLNPGSGGLKLLKYFNVVFPANTPKVIQAIHRC